jgi:short-subunit dehydrogenase
MQLEGRRVLVTGASKGIGRGLAKGFAQAGAVVALVARNAAAIEALARECGGTAHPADLSDRDQVAGLIERVEREAGPIDVLVNNAGLSHIDYVLHQTPAQIDEIFATNLLAPVHLCRQAIPRMLERGAGHVVNISSIAAVLSPPGLVHYGATKAALSHYTACLRQDLRGLPIGLTVVELGSVPTDLDDQTQAYGPYRALRRRLRKSERDADDRVPVEVVVRAVVDAVLHDRRHVRLPRSLAPLAMLTEAPRRVSEWIFRSVDPRPTT